MLILVKAAVAFVLLTILWLIGMFLWFCKHQEELELMKQKAMPYPWFFYVWTLLYFGSIPCGVFLLFYILYKFVGVFIG